MATRKLKKKAAVKTTKKATVTNDRPTNKPVRISRTRKQFVPFSAPAAKPPTSRLKKKLIKRESKKDDIVITKFKGGKIVKKPKKEVKVKEEKERKVGNDRLVPRDNVKEFKVNPFIFGNSNPDFVSRSRVHREVIRALKRKDLNEFKRIISDKNFHYAYLGRSFSYGIPETAHSVALLSGDGKFVEKYLSEFDKFKKDKIDARLDEEPNLLQRKTTGCSNIYMIGRRTRAIQMARGAREGNNALLNYEECPNDPDIGRLLVQSGTDPSLLDKICNNPNSDVSNLQAFVVEAVRMGHRELASKMIDLFGCWDFNDLHKLSLANKKPPAKVLAVSVKKKAHSNRHIMPLHTAAIMDNVDFLKEMRKVEPNLNQCDMDNWTTIHYAAVAEKPTALKYLLSIDTPVVVLNKQLETPLHCAARAGRSENVKILLDWIDKYEKAAKKDESDDDEPPSKKSKSNGDSKSIINYKDKGGRTALHLAVQFQHLNTVETLIANPKTEVEAQTHAGDKKMSPLGIACQSGQLEVAKLLIETGNALIESKDKLRRSPLLHAVMNGQDHVVAYLLKRGADLHKADSSGNAPSHYAAAYGFLSTLKILAEVDPTCLAAKNDWQLTPLSVAYLKGHYGIVIWMLDGPHADHVDINCKDNEGVTLISSLLSYCDMDNAHFLPEQLKFLIDRGTDCSIVDATGNSPLHMFAQVQIPIGENKQKNRLSADEYLACVDTLLTAGADANAKNFANQTAFQIALQSGNLVLAEFLYENSKDKLSLMDSWTEDSNILFDAFALPFVVFKNEKIWSSETGPSINQYNVMALIDDLFKTDAVKVKEWLWQGKGEKKLITPVIQLVESYTELTPKSKDHLAAAKEIHDMALEILWSVLEFDPDCMIQSGPIMAPGQQSLVHLAVVGSELDTKNEHPFITRVLQAAQKNGKLLEILTIRTSDLQTPLQYAIQMANEDTTKLILEFSKKHQCTRGVHDAVFQHWEEIGGKPTSVLKSILHLCVEKEMFTAIKYLELDAAEWKITDKDPSLVVVHRVARGNSAWHYACRKLNQNTIPILKSLKEPPTERNALGQTPLHLAVDSEKTHSADAFLDPIDYVMNHVDVNSKDDHGRTALHYTLLKSSENIYERKPACDPIAVVSLLISHMNKYAIVAPDNDGNTVLHLSAMRDSNICAVTLMRHGCEVTVENNDGNTPLGLAVLNRWPQTALTLIQANSDIQAKVFGPVPKPEKESEWSLTRDVIEEPTQLVTNIPGLVVKNEWHSMVYVILDLVEKKSTAVMAELLHAALANGQHNFSLYLLKMMASALKRSKDAIDILDFGLLSAFVKGLSGKFDQSALNVLSSLLALNITLVDKKGNSQILIDAAAKGRWDLVKFIKNDVSRGSVAWKKISDACFAQILAGFVEFWIKKGPSDDTKSAIEELSTNKAILPLMATYKCTVLFPLLHDKHAEREPCLPVTRAIEARKPELVVFLLSLGFVTPPHALLDAVQTNDRSVVKAVCDLEIEKVEKKTKAVTHNQQGPRHRATVFVTSAAARQLPPRLAKRADEDEEEENEDDEDENTDNTDTSSNNGSVNGGFGMDVVEGESSSESEGSNDSALRKQPLKLSMKNKQIKLDALDSKGRNVFHRLCKPTGWQNIQLFKAIFAVNPAKSKQLITEKADNNGLTAINLAAKLHQRKMLAEMNKLCKAQVKCHTQRHDVSSLVAKYNIDEDAKHYLQMVEDEKMQTDANDVPILDRTPHKLSEYDTKGEIVLDDVTDQLFKILLNKSDLQYGTYGFHNFYRMELIKRKDCDLFILFTNWGRIGFAGENQTTPFSSLEKGVKEFKSVFRQKTGQDWDVFDKIEDLPGKYRLIREDAGSPTLSDLSIEIHSHPTEDETYNFIKDVSDVKSLVKYSKTVKMCQHTMQLPFGRITKETIEKARAVIEKIKTNIKECEKLRAAQKTDMDKLLKVWNELRSLSSEYFSLIPMGGFERCALPVMDSLNNVLECEKSLDDIGQIEIAGRILAAASWRNKECDSIRYIEYALQCDFRALSPKDHISQRILQYISQSTKAPKVLGILEIACKDPYERYEQHINDEDQVFLWHGTKSENLISILRNGLLAVPSNALQCGQAYGKGVYFADSFAKSDGYCHYSADGIKYMLLCQVAPGKTFVWSQVRDPYDNCDTLFVSGEKGPDRSRDVWINGVAMPCGPVKDMPQSIHRYWGASWSEYIVKQESRSMPRFIVMYK